MSTAQNERPRFYEGQYLGAEDMTAAVEYGRIQQARHVLGGHTWGIATGLELREVPSTAGDDKVDVYIQPGYAWDGFGRPVVMLAPWKLAPEEFKDELDGLVKVWLQYAETLTREPRSGFEVCDAKDQRSRIQETFKVAIGDFTHSKQHDLITLSGKPDRIDPLEVNLKTKNTLLCDESVPFQTFPDMDSEEDSICGIPVPSQSTGKNIKVARCLIPLGFVRWNKGAAGSPGYFSKLFDPEETDENKKAKYLLNLKASRSVRQYVGVVAEGLYAADGVIRLRGREKTPPAQGSNSEACESDRLKVDSEDKNRDMIYDKTTSKLNITDLVWIEGNLRATGDIKLFGTKLDFRDDAGNHNDVPLEIRRLEDNGRVGGAGKKGRNLQVVIGRDKDGLNRLSIGSLKNGNIDEKVVVTDAGTVGIGTTNPEGTLHLNTGGNASNDTLIIGNTATKGLRLRDTGDAVDIESVGVALYINNTNNPNQHTLLNPGSGGNVGIGTTNPVSKLEVAGDMALGSMPNGAPRPLPANGTMIWNDGKWLRLNQNLDYSKPIFGVHTPGVFAPGSLNVGGAGSWGDPGWGNVWITGNVGIGTVPAGYTLDVKSIRIKLGLEANGGGQLVLANNPNDNKIFMEAFNTAGDGHASELLLTGRWGGNVPLLSLYADTTHITGDVRYDGKLARLDVADNFSATVRAADFWLGHSSRRGSPGRALVDYGRTLRLNFAGDWPDGVRYYISMSNASSRELKENIKDFSAEEAFEALGRLDPVKFSFKSDKEKRLHLGFIAEDVPDLVSTTDREAVIMDHIITIITKIVKEQQKAISNLEKEVNSLGKQIQKRNVKGSK